MVCGNCKSTRNRMLYRCGESRHWLIYLGFGRFFPDMRCGRRRTRVTKMSKEKFHKKEGLMAGGILNAHGALLRPQ